jgi:phospholipid transport system substrate-binding protein
MVNKFFSLCFSLLLLIGVAGTAAIAQNQEQAIRSMLEQRDREIKSVLGNKTTFTQQQREQLKDLINGIIDFEAMGQAALGPHWNNLTSDQRAEFIDVFSEIVRSQSLADLGIYQTPVTYKSITVNGNKAQVVTEVTYKDVPTRVDYMMGFRNNQWRVEDIVLDGVSTAEGYARSFQSVIRKKGFDSLMASLNKKLEKVTAAK